MSKQESLGSELRSRQQREIGENEEGPAKETKRVRLVRLEENQDGSLGGQLTSMFKDKQLLT